jgi:hypothetical protein
LEREIVEIDQSSAASSDLDWPRDPAAAGRAIERAVFTPGWFPKSTPYHPSLPPRRLRMVEQYQRFSATMLTWPCMGGGGISLPYLAGEISDDLPARYRYYGFVNDREYVRACQASAIKAFGVVFSVQGWEIPAVLNTDESSILELNELHSPDSEHGWVGLREFNQNRYPALWPPFEEFFPDGLLNSEGERITDLWEECASRDVHGNARHAHWLEVPHLKHQCHYMDSNNPGWRAYLKAIVRLQIDAGVDGVQFDEPDTPLSALQYGGCFCKDCVRGFREYLQALPPEERPREIEGENLETFDHRSWVLARGHESMTDEAGTELLDAYLAFGRASMGRNFAELAQYVRDYAASVGREVLVSANTYNMLPVFDELISAVDVCVPEHARTGWKQPAWTRYAAGMSRGKPVCIEVNPYNSPVVPELVANLAEGRMVSRLTTLMYEAAAMGVNLSVPYGSWMGSHSREAFYVPEEPVAAAQSFLVASEGLFSGVSGNDVGVVYSIASCATRSIRAEWLRVPGYQHGKPEEPPLVAATDLADAGIPFDVVVLHDVEPAGPSSLVAQLTRLRTVVAVGCERLSNDDLDAMTAFVDGGGRLLVDSAFAQQADESRRVRILASPGTTVLVGSPAAAIDPQLTVVAVDGSPIDVATNIYELGDGGLAVHLVHYGYDGPTDSTPARTCVVTLASGTKFGRVRGHQPGAPPYAAEFECGDGATKIEVSLGEYTILHLMSELDVSHVASA